MSLRILVVEDNPFNRELLCDWLESEGYGVIPAITLQQAKAAIEQAPPDAVLLDVQLTSEDGLELVAWMRQQTQLVPIPVIAVTAHAMVAEQQRILQSGCNSYVSKPIEFRQLRDQLRRWLGGVRSEG